MTSARRERGAAPLTIAMLAPCAFPANHGTPAAIREMCEALAARGHAVHVVTYPLKEDIPIRDVRIHRVAGNQANHQMAVGPNWQRIGFDLRMIGRAIAVVRHERADVIHAHNYEGALIGTVTRWATGRPLVYNAINTMIDELASYQFIRPRFLANAMARMLDYWAPRGASKIIADTQSLRNFLLDRGLSERRIDVIPSGVHVEMFDGGNASAVRSELALGTRPVVLYTGTFDGFQGVDRLVRAFPLVLQSMPNATLVLVGSTVRGEHRASLLALANELGIGSRVIVSHSSLERLPDFLAAADVAVVPRVTAAGTGIPTKLLNYMAAGRPIVSFAGVAGVIEHGRSGWLVEGEDNAALAAGILKLLADRKLADELGQNAKRLALEKFDWQSIAARIESVYRSLLT